MAILPKKRERPYVFGLDESGTGALAGPYVLGGVVLRRGQRIVGVTDSKKLTDAKRRGLVPIIESAALVAKRCVVPVDWMNAHGMSDSWSIALAVLVAEVIDELGQHSVDLTDVDIVVDGLSKVRTATYLALATGCGRLPLRYEPKADVNVVAVSAASILAKTLRNDLMIELAREVPDYRFDQHMGYGTSAHMAALDTYGRTVHHRPLTGTRWAAPNQEMNHGQEA